MMSEKTLSVGITLKIEILSTDTMLVNLDLRVVT